MNDDVDVREAAVHLDGAVYLHYADTGGGDGPPLVLVHGYVDSWRSFALVLPLLARTRRVIAVDLRGHGDSATPVGDYPMPRLAQDVIELLERLGVPRAAVLGHSMGSFVARLMALEAPSRVDRLILVGTATTADNAVLRELRAEVRRHAEWIPEDFVDAFQAGCVHRRELVPERFFASCVATARRTPVHVWHAALDGVIADDHRDRLAAIPQPTLVLGGEDDQVFSAAEQRAAADAMPHAQLRLYRYAGHCPQWEQPGRFVEDVENFLAGRG